MFGDDRDKKKNKNKNKATVILYDDYIMSVRSLFWLPNISIPGLLCKRIDINM